MFPISQIIILLGMLVIGIVYCSYLNYPIVLFNLKKALFLIKFKIKQKIANLQKFRDQEIHREEFLILGFDLTWLKIVKTKNFEICTKAGTIR